MPKFRPLRRLWPLGLAQVSGESMAPYLRDGSLILLYWFDARRTDLRLGTVVLIEREVMPGVIFVKRIQKSHGGAYWVEGDNRDPLVEERMNDSRTWGYIRADEIRGRVLIRLRRKPLRISPR